MKSIRRGGGGSITTTTYRLINQATVETSRKAISATIRVLLSTSTNSAAVLQHRNCDTETSVLCANRRPISSSSKCHFREPNFKTFQEGGGCPHPPRNVSSFWAHAPVLWPSKNKKNPYLALPKKHLSSPGIGIWARCHPHTREFEREDDNEVNVAGGMH